MLGLAIFQARGYDLTIIIFSRGRCGSDLERSQQEYTYDVKTTESDSPSKSTLEHRERLFEVQGQDHQSTRRQSISRDLALLCARPSLATLRNSMTASTPPPRHPLPPLPPYRPAQTFTIGSAPSTRCLPERPPRLHHLHPAYHLFSGPTLPRREDPGQSADIILSRPRPVLLKRPESSVYSRDVSGDGKEVGGLHTRYRHSTQLML